MFQFECNSHADLLMITHEGSSVIMKHRLILNLFELASNSSNVSNRVNVPRCSHVFAQLKFLFQPGGRKQARYRSRGVSSEEQWSFQPRGVRHSIAGTWFQQRVSQISCYRSVVLAFRRASLIVSRRLSIFLVDLKCLSSRVSVIA